MRGRRRVVIAAVSVVGIGAVLWLRSAGESVTRTIPTGAGFTVTVAQMPGEPQARTMAARVAAVGLPAFTRRSDRSFQVVAGPYVSLDEAEATQHFLAKRGFKARVLVDESVRRAADDEGTPIVSKAADVLLIAGAGSLAVVIELPAEPRHVATQLINPHQLEIVAAPAASRVDAIEWKAPAGVALLRRVSIDEVGQGRTRALRARILLPPSVQPNVRTAGRRIYIDLARPAALPEPEMLEVGVMRATRERVVEDYRVTIAPVLEKLETIEPFVMAAVAQPTGDVLAALERSIRAMESWTGDITPPGRWRQSHDYIVSAVAKAAEAVSAGFTGDREGKAREAFAMRDAAIDALATPADEPPVSH